MAFQFPADPVNHQTVINPATETTYIWLDAPGKWVIEPAASTPGPEGPIGPIGPQGPPGPEGPAGPGFDDIDNYVTKTEAQATTDILTAKDQIQDVQIAALQERQSKSFRYTIESTSMGVATRAGELIVNNVDATDVDYFSVGSVDLDGEPIATPIEGDTIYMHRESGNVHEEARYIIGANPTLAAMNVTLVFENTIGALAATQEWYLEIFPTNTTSATVEYVDAQNQLQNQVIAENTLAITDCVNLNPDGAEQTITGASLYLKPDVSDGNGPSLGIKHADGALAWSVWHPNVSDKSAPVKFTTRDGAPHNFYNNPVDNSGASLSFSINIDSVASQLPFNSYDDISGYGATTKFSLKDDAGVEYGYWWHQAAGHQTPLKMVGRNGNELWFQCYDDNDENVVTQAKFSSNNVIIQNGASGNNIVSWSITDAHYVAGTTVFKNYGGEQIFKVALDGSLTTKTGWTPTQDDHLANKRYVDAAIAPTPVLIPASWKSVSGAPSGGEFNYTDTKITCSKYTDSDLVLGTPNSGTTSVARTFTIWTRSFDNWSMRKTGAVTSVVFQNNQTFEINISDVLSSGSINPLGIYYITVSGLF